MKEVFLERRISFNHYQNGYENILIIAPGWFMTKDSKIFLDLANSFGEFFDIGVIDFRGHGRSKGFFTFSAKEYLDLKKLIDFVKPQYKKIYLLGFSLGAATSVIHTALEHNIDKLILVSTPCCFSKIENQIWQKNAWLPTVKKFELKRWCSIRPSLLPYKKIKPIDVISQINIPILFITGEKDPIVFSWHTKKLFDNAQCKKSLKIFQNGKHAEDLFSDYKTEFIQLCKNWLITQ